jgi:hypothetical protein
MKKCLSSLAIKEMQITTTLRVYLIPVRIATIKNTNNKCWSVCKEKRIFIHCWWECKLVQPLWKTVWRILKKLKINLQYDLTILLLRINPEEYESSTCMPMFIDALFPIAKLSKQPKCPTTDEQIKNVVFIYNGILLIHKEE